MERFLLAQLYLTSLEDKTTIKAVKFALSHLKKQTQGSTEDGKLNILETAYDEAMKRIKDQRAGFRLLAERVLSWITCATRSLKTLELQHALAIELGERELDGENIPQIEQMVSVCSGLVTVDRESGVVRLIHYTTQEYLDRTKDRWFPTAHEDISNACITYLSFSAFSTGFCHSYRDYKQRLESYPLYHYATHNWARHAHISNNSAIQSATTVISFMEQDRNVEATFQLLLADERDSASVATSQVPQQTRGLHLAAYWGLDGALAELLTRGYGSECRDSLGQTPLLYAARRGNLSTVKILLGCREGIDANAADGEGATPLIHAVRGGHSAVVNLLLLLDRLWVDVNHRDNNGQTALMWAARSHRWDILIQLLADGRADANMKDGFGQSALALSAEKAPAHVVERFLEVDGIKIDASDICGLTPLALAMSFGNAEVTKLLQEKLPVIPLPEYRPNLVKRVIREVRRLNFDLPCYLLPVRCVDNDLVSFTTLCCGVLCLKLVSIAQPRTLISLSSYDGEGQL